MITPFPKHLVAPIPRPYNFTVRDLNNHIFNLPDGAKRMSIFPGGIDSFNVSLSGNANYSNDGGLYPVTYTSETAGNGFSVAPGNNDILYDVSGVNQVTFAAFVASVPDPRTFSCLIWNEEFGITMSDPVFASRFTHPVLPLGRMYNVTPHNAATRYFVIPDGAKYLKFQAADYPFLVNFGSNCLYSQEKNGGTYPETFTSETAGDGFMVGYQNWDMIFDVSGLSQMSFRQTVDFSTMSFMIW